MSLVRAGCWAGRYPYKVKPQRKVRCLNVPNLHILAAGRPSRKRLPPSVTKIPPSWRPLLQGGLDLDVPIQLSEYIKLMPLEIAVFRNDVPMIHFLLEHGADPDLAVEQPLLLTAARCCGPEVVTLFAGQAAKLSPKQKERAFQEVRWASDRRIFPYWSEAGITVDKFGGEAFRAAVSDGQAELAKLLLEKGADINYHKPDMVFPYASTPVTEAARSNNFLMVRWLVEHGADITIVDKYGDRPYSVAVQNKNQEMADYLKALEPEEWHNEQEKLRQLMPYKLPAKLVEYLKTGPLRLEFPEQEWVKWAELYSFLDVQEMTWKRKKLLSLMVQMDNYSDYLLLWSPRDKKAVVSGHRARGIPSPGQMG